MSSRERFAAALPVRPVRRAFEQVADQLRDHIVGGQLGAGDRLPTEAELCQRFGVSRSTVREALRTLSSEGLVTTSRGASGGTFVAVPETDAVVHYLTSTLTLLAGSREVSVDDLLEARELLEVPAARSAAVHGGAGLVERLRATLPDTRAGGRAFEVNRAFHELVLAAGPNPLLRVMTQPIFATLQTRFLRDRATAEFWTEVHHDHSAILEAIADGDPGAAGHAMAEHLHHLRGTYRRIDAIDAMDAMDEPTRGSA